MADDSVFSTSADDESNPEISGTALPAKLVDALFACARLELRFEPVNPATVADELGVTSHIALARLEALLDCGYISRA